MADFAAPAGSMLMREAPAILQLPRLLLQAPKLIRAPHGNEPVVAFPGFGTNDAITLPLRRALSGLGHDVHGWGLGRNRGDVAGDIDAATAVVRKVHEQAQARVALLGWSLGGVFAREIARDNPDMVQHVFTWGTPVVGGPRYTRSARAYSEDQMDEIEVRMEERDARLITCPITAWWSKSDGVVDWRACKDTINPHVEHIEVRSTHVGMMIDPDIWTGIANRLVDQPPTGE